MEFVDRTDEIARIKCTLSRSSSSLVVIYGRRRLGKSTLIRKVLTDKDVYFLADRSERQYQISLLAKVIAEKFPDFDKLTYPDWESLLMAVNYRAHEHFSLCLDEFPYMVEQSSELPSVLQKLIDGRQLKYSIVLCGSSQNMMFGLFLDSKAPLYGRADEIIRLKPIPLPYIQEALGVGDIDAIEEYSVWGGVPRYWELRENLSSLKEAIWHNVLSVNGILYEEPIKLLQDDVKDVVKTSTIMSYVGNGCNRLSEIAARCGEPSTNLSRPLRKLVDLGFLEREVPFGVDEKNAKKSLYKISDPFMAFYYRFVVPNRSFIEIGRNMPVKEALTAHFEEYVSLQWEKICREAVFGNVVDGVAYGMARRWWGPVVNSDNKPVQVEFDVMAESLDKRRLLVGECKWTSNENGRQLTDNLMQKASLLPFAKKYEIVPVLFLKHRPAEDEGNIMLPSDVINLYRQ